MDIRAYSVALGLQQMVRPEWVEKFIPRHADWGYTHLILYLEDAYRFPSHPEIARKSAWTKREMERVVGCADKQGIKVIPVVPSLGHTSYITKSPQCRHLSEKRAEKGKDGKPFISGGQVCPSLEGTYRLLDDLYADVAPYCTAGYLHVGLDESMESGMCELCKPKVAKSGHAGLFLEHLKRLTTLVNSRGLKIAVWGDMFYYFPEIIRKVSRDVAVFDWYYYPFKRMPRVELYNFREIDSARILRKAGLEVWAVPNSGAFFDETTTPFSHCLRNIRDWWRYGHETGCHALAISSWCALYSSMELACLVNAAAADLWLSPATRDPRDMLKHGFKRLYGREGGAAIPMYEALDQERLCGFWNNQIVRGPLNKLADLSPAETFTSRAALYRKIAAKRRDRGTNAVQEAWDIRAYYFARERLARQGSLHLVEARQAHQANDRPSFARAIRQVVTLLKAAESALPAAKQASNRFWKAERPAGEPNPGLKVMKEDAKTLAGVDRYLKGLAKKPGRIMEPCALLAARQLVVPVANRKPCMQALAVEFSADGSLFKEAHRLYLQQFSADAARPKTNFIHRHVVPIPEELAGKSLFVRLRAAGLGKVEVAPPVLIEGAELKRPVRIVDQAGIVTKARNIFGAGWVEMGDPAPEKGFPAPEWFARDHHVTVSMD